MFNSMSARLPSTSRLPTPAGPGAAACPRLESYLDEAGPEQGQYRIRRKFVPYGSVTDSRHRERVQWGKFSPKISIKTKKIDSTFLFAGFNSSNEAQKSSKKLRQNENIVEILPGAIFKKLYSLSTFG
jgi:hypothetical protein